MTFSSPKRGIIFVTTHSAADHSQLGAGRDDRFVAMRLLAKSHVAVVALKTQFSAASGRGQLAVSLVRRDEKGRKRVLFGKRTKNVWGKNFWGLKHDRV